MATDLTPPPDDEGPELGDETLGLPGPAERLPKRPITEPTTINDDDDEIDGE